MKDKSNGDDPKDKTIESHRDIWMDTDLAELLFLSEENRNDEIIPAEDADIETEDKLEIPNIQDPEKAYELYHKTLQPLLKKNLQGASTQARTMIREQVNLLLKDGHKKGRDGKQAYLNRVERVINIILKWEGLCASNGIPITESKFFRLYCELKDAVNELTNSIQ